MTKPIKEFVFAEGGEKHSINEIINKVEECKYNINNYRNKIYCPECGICKLRFTPKYSKHCAYLSKLPSSSHSYNCSYNNKIKNKTIQKKKFKTPTKKEINDDLEKALYYLARVHNNNNSFSYNNQSNKNEIKLASKIYGKYNSRILKWKSIRNINDDDINKVYLLYGKGYIKKIKNTNNLKKSGKPYLYQLFIEDHGFRHLKITIFTNKKFNFKENVLYDLAMYGVVYEYSGFLQVKGLDQSFNYFRFNESK